MRRSWRRPCASYCGDAADVLVATKGGHTRDGAARVPRRPARVPQAGVRGVARRLGVDAIGLYQFHRPDPKVPYEESMGGLADLLDEG